MIRKFYQINQYIKSDKLRVITETGVQLGILSKSQALNQAHDQGKDLIIVAEKADPPVAKIIEFSKFKYQQSKKEKSGTQKSKATDVKEVRFTPFMAAGDFQTRISRTQEFLTAGHPVKLVVKFIGRQLSRKEFGAKVMDQALAKLADLAVVDQPAKWQGKFYFAQIKPKTKAKSNETSQDKN